MTEPSNEDTADKNYALGSRAAWLTMMLTCLRELGYDDTEAQKVAWIVEREAAIQTLRSACEEFGDNDWTERLNLSDIIEKHLVRYIENE